MKSGYLLFALAAIGLSAIGTLASFFNPVTLLLLNLAAPLVRLVGRTPSYQGWSGLGSAIGVSLIWPLLLVPLHWLCFHVLRWPWWGYALLFLGAGVCVAFIVMLIRS